MQRFQELLLTTRKIESGTRFTFASAGFVFSQYGDDHVTIGSSACRFGNAFLFFIRQCGGDDFAVGPVGIFYFASFGVGYFNLVAQIILDAVVNRDIIQSLRTVTADHIVGFLCQRTSDKHFLCLVLIQRQQVIFVLQQDERLLLHIQYEVAVFVCTYDLVGCFRVFYVRGIE